MYYLLSVRKFHLLLRLCGYLLFHLIICLHTSNDFLHAGCLPDQQIGDLGNEVAFGMRLIQLECVAIGGKLSVRDVRWHLQLELFDVQ